MTGSTTERALPFRRGSTYKDGSPMTLASTSGETIVGEVYTTTDSSSRKLRLRVVRADNALTNVGRKTVSYTAAKIGRNVDALTNTNGEIASIVDDAYATTFDVDQYDLFYVVEEGFVDAAAEAGVNAAGLKVAAYAANDNVTVAVAADYIIGVSTEAVSSGIAEIHVLGGLKPSDPAS